MIAQELAHFVTSLKFEDLSSETVIMAKRCIIDHIANALAGCKTEVGKMIGEYVKSFQGTPSTTLIGSGKHFYEKSCFGNAVISRVLDLDDGHRFSLGHPGTVIIPTALTVGELENASSRDVITAIVAGYDIYVRVGSAINPSSHKEKGYDTTGVCGVLAAAVVAGKLFNLDDEKMVNALGIAGSYTGGLYECLTNGSMPKLLCPRWASTTGISSARLAKAGFTGPGTIIEGKKGLCQAVSNTYNLDHILDNIGTSFSINSVYFKKYACMRGLHAGIDALLSLKSRYMIRDSSITKIVVYTSSFVQQYDKIKPDTLVGAQASLPFSLAVALHKGKVGINDMTEGLRDPKIYETASKVKIVVDPGIEEYVKKNPSELAAVKLEVHTIDGNIYYEQVLLPKGEPENPISDNELKEKFYSLASTTLSSYECDYAYKELKDFEQLNSISSIVSLLGKA